MPVCPECRAEYRAGFSTCAECGVPLVAALPHEGWVEVFRGDAIGAETARAVLESAGIVAMAPDQNLSGLQLPDAGFCFRVMVKASDVASAIKVLEKEMPL